MTREEILDTAKRIVNGDRDSQYGTPENSFYNIATLWNAYLTGKKGCKLVNGVDVAVMMLLLKVARLMADPTKADSWIDLAGYAACGGELGIRSEPRTPDRLPPDPLANETEFKDWRESR